MKKESSIKMDGNEKVEWAHAHICIKYLCLYVCINVYAQLFLCVYAVWTTLFLIWLMSS